MSSELVDIQPRELKFLFELKKQSVCCVRLVNKFSDYVAFKVKTTSPKKYCVRPNIGIIKPNSSCEFTVTMQAPKVAPPDMICKDKFLVQSTVVPAGTTDDDITSSMFSKDDGRYVEEVKLRVTLLSPPNSPILSPINEISKQKPVHEASTLKDPVIHKFGSFKQKYHVHEDLVMPYVNNSKVVNIVKDLKYETMKEVEDLAEHKFVKEVEDPVKNGVYETAQAEEPMRNKDYTTLNFVKDGEGLLKDGFYKPLNSVMGEEDPMKNGVHKPLKYVMVEDPTKYGVYESQNHTKDAEDPIKDVEYDKFKIEKHLERSLMDVDKRMNEVKEPADNTEYSAVDDKEVSEKNGVDKSLNYVMDKEDPTKGIEYGKLNTLKHWEQLLEDVYKPTKEVQEPLKDAECTFVDDGVVPAKDLHDNTAKDMESSKLVKDIEQMKLKLNKLESKLTEAEVTISKLNEERRWTGQERENLGQELALLRSKRGDRKVQVGFPFLFVCMVALVSIVLGYTLRC